MRKMKMHIAIIFFLSAFFTNSDAQNNCNLKKDQDGIRVYSCKTDSSEFKAVKAEFELYTSIDKYLDLVLDIDNYKNWHYKSIEPRLLKKISERELIYYTQIEAPWPVQNRDLILHLRLVQDMETGVLTVHLKSLPEYLSEDKEYMRIPYSKSVMIMTPNLEGTSITVDYSILADPGGSLPTWVVNLVSAQGPYETFKRMKEILEESNL